MVEIRPGAIFPLMKRAYGAAVIVEIGICAGDIAGALDTAVKPVDTRMVVRFARTRMVRRAADVRQCTEIIVEGMVFLHYDDDVLDIVQIAVGIGTASCNRKPHACSQNEGKNPVGIHRSLPDVGMANARIITLASY